MNNTKTYAFRFTPKEMRLIRNALETIVFTEEPITTAEIKAHLEEIADRFSEKIREDIINNNTAKEA